MSKLLLFSLFLPLVGSSGLVAAQTAQSTMPDDGNASIYRLPVSPQKLDHMQIDNSADADRYCLNIHAFIFKTDDDRVPKLVGETTCMPAGSVKAKRALGSAKPKLVPATGESSF